jgi:hypothetical protein
VSAGPGRRYLGFVLLAAAVSAAIAAVGVPLTRAAAGAAAVPATIAALAVCWAAAVVGGVPLWRAGAAGEVAAPGAMLTAALAAMGLRLAVAVAGAAALAVAGTVPRTPLLVWTAVGYLALLAVETRYAVGEVRARERSAAAAGTVAGNG